MTKLEKIDSLLRDIVWATHTMSDDKDSDYKNLDEVISYLETIQCVMTQKVQDTILKG